MPNNADICPKCGIDTKNKESIAEVLQTCPSCGYHYRMEPLERIAYIADTGSFVEFSAELSSLNPIAFTDYEEKLSDAKTETRMKEAVITGTCLIEGKPAILGLMSFDFIGGSMGSVVGEKISRAMLKGAQEKLPVIFYTSSGGARMQEGIFSLMQMAKTASAAAELDKAGVPFFNILCDPTTGGVTASFAMLADITIAEPGALIGFAGPRVIKGTINQELPEGFQRSEFLLEKGFVDIISPRKEQRMLLSRLIDMHRKAPLDLAQAVPQGKVAGAGAFPPEATKPTAESAPAQQQSGNPDDSKADAVWKQVKLARHSARPCSMDYIDRIFDSFTELHGDRCYGDDSAIVGGLAFIDGQPVTVIANQKGRTVEEKLQRNLGMAHPEGYRKALRLAKQAEKFNRPVITIVDTVGAYPGVGAEERGIGESIARTLREFSQLKTPVVCIIIGEGGSGGALSFCVCDRLYMLENAIFFVISPEGCALILLRDAARAKDAAAMLRITSADLLEFNIIDGIIKEAPDGAHAEIDVSANSIKEILLRDLAELQSLGPEALVSCRNEKIRKIGIWKE